MRSFKTLFFFFFCIRKSKDKTSGSNAKTSLIIIEPDLRNPVKGILPSISFDTVVDGLRNYFFSIVFSTIIIYWYFYAVKDNVIVVKIMLRVFFLNKNSLV